MCSSPVNRGKRPIEREEKPQPFGADSDKIALILRAEKILEREFKRPYIDTAGNLSTIRMTLPATPDSPSLPKKPIAAEPSSPFPADSEMPTQTEMDGLSPFTIRRPRVPRTTPLSSETTSPFSAAQSAPTDAKKKLKFTLPNSPSPSKTNGKEFTLLPPTPHKPKKNPVEKEPNFPGELPSEMEKNLKIEHPRKINLDKAYILDGIQHTLVQQSTNKGCGASAVLMLYTDVLRKQPDLKMDPEFWEWYGTCSLANAKEVAAGAKKINALFELNISKVTGDPLEFIRKKIHETALPVITSITHPALAGHWIVIDRITDKETYLRDPNSGKAFLVPNPEMRTYFDSDLEHCLSVTSKITH